MNPNEYSRLIQQLAEKRNPFAIATVVRIEGSTLAKPGFKIIVDSDGNVLGGTLGGACPEGPIVQVALEAMLKRQPRVVRVYLQDAASALGGLISSRNPDDIYVETNCGGTLEVYVEPYIQADRLILVGEGGKDDVEESILRLAKLLGFEVIVVDPKPALVEKPDLLIQDLNYDLRNFKFMKTDSVVILTRGGRDVAILESLAQPQLRFVGLLASKKRVQQDFEALKEKGVREGFLVSIHAPIGLDIGAITPMEIALSIMGEVIAVKYGKKPATKDLESTATPKVEAKVRR